MVFGNAIITLAKGEQKKPEVVLKQGENQFFLFGDASVTFRYRKGCL